jgi:hypothetical protein
MSVSNSKPSFSSLCATRWKNSAFVAPHHRTFVLNRPIVSQAASGARAGAASALKERERDDEIARLKSKVSEITTDNELLYAKITGSSAVDTLRSSASFTV